MASAARRGGLNRRLVQFSRRQPPDPKPLAINDLIMGMEEIVRRSLPNSIRLELDLAADLWEARCDAGDAETALLNLALNARDAMPDGGVLMIQTRNVEVENDGTVDPAIMAPGQYICLAVSDSGTGMTPDVNQRAFDAFFTTKANKMGIGLGLTMVRRFARENGGDAKIESEIARGTSVSFTCRVIARNSNGGQTRLVSASVRRSRSSPRAKKPGQKLTAFAGAHAAGHRRVVIEPGSAKRSITEPHAPVLGSGRTVDHRAIRACRIAPAHIAHGSIVT
jgi:hypothetical protein